MRKIKPIEQSYDVDGMLYELVQREGMVALFRQPHKERYEVHKIRVKLPGEFSKESLTKQGYTHYEKLASTEDFGRYGWCYNTKELAEAQFKHLVYAAGRLSRANPVQTIPF